MVRVTRRVAGIALLVAASIFSPSNAEAACNPNENCETCLIPRPFGGCIQRGLDPACQARKALCLPPPPPPLQLPGVGGPLGPGAFAPPIGPTAEQVQECLRTPQSCPETIARTAFYSQVKPAADAYIADLRFKASGRWERIPENLITQLRSFYPGIDLSRVRYATNIDTLHGQHITIGYQVFFTETMDFSHSADLLTLFHELEHVKQYAQKGGVESFLADYLMEIPLSVVSNRSFKVHDSLTLENAAIEAADRVLMATRGHDIKFTTTCDHPISISVIYLDKSDNTWRQNSLSTINVGDDIYLNRGREDDPILTVNRKYYFRARTIDGSGLSWGGNQNVVADGVTWAGYKLRDEQDKRVGTYGTELQCSR